MRDVFSVSITVQAPNDPNAFSTNFLTDVAPNPRAIEAFVAMHGWRCTVDVAKHGLSSTNGVDFVATWLAEIMPMPEPATQVEPEPALTPDPRDSRMNEMDRSLRNVERQMAQLIAALTPQAPQAQEPAEWQRQVQAQPVPRAGVNDPRRSARRGATPEFNADPEHRSNSMATVGTPASPFMAGKGSTGASRGTFFLAPGADANGNPTVIEEAPPIVGDTLTRGTR